MIPLRTTQPKYSKPEITLLLIAANAMVFLFEISLDPYSLNHFIARYGLTPDRFQVIDMLTSMFLHGGWMHILGNMWFLWVFGGNMEDRLGHGRYLVFYLLCGLAASMTQVLLNPVSHVPMVGASGAIAGVMGGYIVKYPRSGVKTLVPLFVFFFTVEVPAFVILGYWFLVQLMSGWGSIGYSHLSEGGVAFWAHVGGFVTGMILVNTMGGRKRYLHRSDLTW